MSSDISSPTSAERAAVCRSSSGVPQKSRRRMAYRFMPTKLRERRGGGIGRSAVVRAPGCRIRYHPLYHRITAALPPSPRVRAMQSTGQQRGLKAMWRTERRARWFFAAHLQGALGTGAGYVALLLLAYEQMGSAWGATAVLIADLAPAMLLGPLLGGLIDRRGRVRSAVAADLIGALAFGGLVFAHGAATLIGLALAAGLGSALLRPATCALLPAIVSPQRLSSANGVFGAVREIGQLIGPAVAGGVMMLTSPQLVLGLNAVTFAASALLISRLRGRLNPVA